MSQTYDGRNMDRPLQSKSGSVRRARERAQAGLPRERMPTRPPPPPMMMMMQDSLQGGLSPPPSRPAPDPFGAPPRAYRPRIAPQIEGRAGQPISRPTRIPQWPLPSSPVSPLPSTDRGAYRPPPNRPQQAPQRPPRPSVVPSIVDQSRLQEPTPVFFTRDYEAADEYGADGQPVSPNSRLTTSSVGSIPEFPEPAMTPAAPSVPAPRRSANLGPPPSSRRGASSFYSHASYVSPIPEESPRSRSHVSGASSGVIPEGRAIGSPLGSPDDAFYDDSVTDRSRESVYEEFGDESKLVRSASIGKKGKPALVVTRAPGQARGLQTTSPYPFGGGSGLEEEDSSFQAAPPTTKQSPQFTSGDQGVPVTQEAMLGAYAAASSGASVLRRMTPSPKPPSRLSGLKRPPKLDIDAVREMEARGSITSLPDLIRRATRLAAMIDRGKRPASRFDNLNDFLDEPNGSRDGDKEGTLDDKHQSGLSDMLAAFPPPAQEGRQTRSSWFRTTSWPLAPGRPGAQPQRSLEKGGADGETPAKKKGRRCCGMPMCLFIIVLILLLCAIAAAIVVPLEFFVFKNLPLNKKAALTSLEQCRNDLRCLNGGANVVSQGNCSCVCTSGFVGRECEIGGTQGCTTTNLVSSNGETTVRNVTLGRSVPRVIARSAQNFTVPLSGTAILAKFSAANLSCIAQNSLVTFNGRSVRLGSVSADTQSIAALKDDGLNIGLAAEPFVPVTALTEPLPMMTPPPDPRDGVNSHKFRRQNLDTMTKLLLDTASAPAIPSKTSSGPAPTGSANTGTGKVDDGRFIASEEVMDFARVAVLFILQEQDPNTAETAQTQIQRFFTRAADRTGAGVNPEEASRLDVGTNTTINFIQFTIRLGSRQVGGLNETNSNLGKREWSAGDHQPILPQHFHAKRSRSLY